MKIWEKLPKMRRLAAPSACRANKIALKYQKIAVKRKRALNKLARRFQNGVDDALDPARFIYS